MSQADEGGKPLIVISPPGSMEAGDIGYVNIPKISKEPPPEFYGPQGVHWFEDGTGYKFKDDANNEYSLQPSNVWLLAAKIAGVSRSLDTLVPLFPDSFQFAIPWVACEYALYCSGSDQNDLQNFISFTKNILKRRASSFERITDFWIVLHEQRMHWRGAKKNPIHYLNVIIKHDDMRDRELSGSLFDDGVMSFETPLLTAEELTLGDMLFDPHEDSKNILHEACKVTRLSSDATALLLTKIDVCGETAQLTDACEALGFDHTKYESLRKEINRKKPELKQNILTISKEYEVRKYTPRRISKGMMLDSSLDENEE